MEARCYLDGGEMQISGPRLRWDSTETKKKREFGSLGGEETQISRPGWGWDGTWIELRCTSWDEDGVFWDWDGAEIQFSSWERAWMEVRHIVKPVWVWDDAWMELRCNFLDLNGGEIFPGCRRDVNIRTQNEVGFNWDKEETWIWEPEWRSDTNLETWMGLRFDLDWVEMHILRRG